MLIGRFCKFPKRKTVNYHMQVVRGEESWQNPVIIEVRISYQVINYQGIVLVGSDGALAPNGPEIKGGCGTWRSPSVNVSRYFSRNLSRWQDRYGVLFADPGISFIVKRCERGISFQMDEYLSRYSNLEKASCAVSRYKLSRSHKLSWYRELYY
jgi:hypothetical protein